MLAKGHAVPIPPDLAALCNLLRPALDLPETGEAATIDGAVVRSAARRHRVGPLLAHAAEASGKAICDEEAQALLAQLREQAGQRVARNKLAAARLQDMIAAAGIDALGCKGAALAEALYGQACLRPSRDVDLLVARRDASAAAEILAAAGLAHVVHGDKPGQGNARAGSPRRRALEMRVFKDVEFRDPVTQVTVELHGRLFVVEPRGFSSALSQENAGLRDASLASDHYCLYLVLHGAASFWPRLRWVADLSRLLRLADPARRAAIAGLARRYGAQDAFAASLLLCEQCFPGSVAPDWQAQAPPGAAARALAARFMRQLSGHAPGDAMRPPGLGMMEFPPRKVFGSHAGVAALAGQRIAKALMLRI